MTKKTIKLVEDFTDAPGGRSRAQGDHTGEEFREDILKPALLKYDVVSVNLNGALGLPSSFLDEAFGSFRKEYMSGKLVIELDDNPVAQVLIRQLIGDQVDK